MSSGLPEAGRKLNALTQEHLQRDGAVPWQPPTQAEGADESGK